MSDKFEFGDFYKFITSVGLALVGLSFAVPWVFLRERFDLTVSRDILKTLPIQSANIVARRLQIEEWIFRYLPTASVTLFIVGTLIFCLGCYMWWPRQKWRDRAENALTQGAERGLMALTPAQIVARATVGEADSSINTEDAVIETPAQERAVVSSAVMSYMDMEKHVFDRLNACLSDTHYVISQQRLGAAVFDFILQDKNTGRSDAIIELKVRVTPPNTSWILESARQAALGAQAYAATTRKSAIPILLIVVPNSWGSSEKLLERATKIKELDPSVRLVRISVFREEEFFSAHCGEIRQYFGI
jgi:hypothetical protein